MENFVPAQHVRTRAYLPAAAAAAAVLLPAARTESKKVHPYYVVHDALLPLPP